MKLIALTVLLSLVACGKRDPLPYSLAKGIGAEESGDINRLKGEVAKTQRELELLRAQLSEIAASLETSVNALELSLQLAIVEGDEATANTFTAQIEALQGQHDATVERLIALELEERVVEIFDPCPTVNGGHKEMLFKTSTGKVVGYFEHGNHRFLAVLKPGTYRTTDARNCQFVVE